MIINTPVTHHCHHADNLELKIVIKSGALSPSKSSNLQIKDYITIVLRCFYVKSPVDSLPLRLHLDKCRPSGRLRIRTPTP